ncbi:MAG: hypothetical protein RLZZ127_3344, partial [Planctomycetota bacterium]
ARRRRPGLRPAPAAPPALRIAEAAGDPATGFAAASALYPAMVPRLGVSSGSVGPRAPDAPHLRMLPPCHAGIVLSMA